MTTEEAKTLLYIIFGANFKYNNNTPNIFYANYNTSKYIEVVYNNYYLKITVTNQNYVNIIQCLNKNFKLGYVESSYITNNVILCAGSNKNCGVYELQCIKFVFYNKLKNIDI